MTLREYLASLTTEERHALWEGSRSTRQYIYAISSGIRRCSPQYAMWLSEQTGGKVPLHELRPDIWKAPQRGRNS